MTPAVHARTLAIAAAYGAVWWLLTREALFALQVLLVTAAGIHPDRASPARQFERAGLVSGFMATAELWRRATMR